MGKVVGVLCFVLLCALIALPYGMAHNLHDRLKRVEERSNRIDEGLDGAILVKGEIWGEIFTTLHRDYMYVQQMQQVRPQNKALGSPEE